ncbi:MAG: alpha/beta hydrolase [Actinomycetota bacterium]|nr:alpha/beta hydrolase [Actinomycetota bacterium]
MLVDAGFRPIAIDGPGFGRSRLLASDRYQRASLVELMQRLVDGLELDRPVLMGHSWGGVGALSFAAAHLPTTCARSSSSRAATSTTACCPTSIRA